MTQAYPLQWPAGWKRTPAAERRRGQFGTQETRSNTAGNRWQSKKSLSLEEATRRVRGELEKLGVDVRDDVIISTNLTLNLSGYPRGNQPAPADPGVAVYWQKPKQPMRVMAIDAYDTVAQNLGAIAATLEAMRAIERHGGAAILDRAFTGFDALPAPKSPWDILGLKPGSSRDEVQRAWRKLASEQHPDRGGSEARMAEINAARDAALRGAP